MIALVTEDGRRIGLDVDRWHDDVTPAEWKVLRRLEGPIIDIGCGPGRVVAALAAAGRPCLGIDPSPAAVAFARRRGAPVLKRSVFDRVPGEGRWAAAVLLDGNIGIGGDPLVLLARVRRLLRPGGRLLVELDAPGSGTDRLAVRLESAGMPTGPRFSWACVDASDFAALAGAAGLEAGVVEAVGGRWFAEARCR